MDNKRTIMPNGRYTDDELELFKKVFAENEPLIKIVRKVLLELSMDEREETQWRNTFTGNEPLNFLMRKMFLPTLDGDTPIGQQIDLWLTVNLENKLPEEAKELIASRKLVIQYLDVKLRELSGTLTDHRPFDSFDLLDPIGLKARNTIIMHIEHQLLEIKGLAGFKKESASETIARLSKNSSK